MAEAADSPGGAPTEDPSPEPDLPRMSWAQVSEQGFLQFAPPSPPTAEAAALTADIVNLDHRIHRRLGVNSSDWNEVMGVLMNAAGLLAFGRLDDARKLFGRAEAIWLLT